MIFQDDKKKNTYEQLKIKHQKQTHIILTCVEACNMYGKQGKGQGIIQGFKIQGLCPAYPACHNSKSCQADDPSW